MSPIKAEGYLHDDGGVAVSSAMGHLLKSCAASPRATLKGDPHTNVDATGLDRLPIMPENRYYVCV